ncbi:MAG: aromatic amino acid lyase, partial [Ekhidna sp.]
MANDTSKFHYGEDHLTVGIALAIARQEVKGVLSSSAREAIKRSAAHVKTIANGDKAVYGINTGFGPLCTTQISKEETSTLQKNLLMSHAVGLGDPIADEIAKLMLILKVHALAK